MDILIVYVDDWFGLYIDEKFKCAGHSLDPDTLLKHLGIEYENVWLDDNKEFDQLVQDEGMPDYDVVKKFLEQ